MYSLLQEMLGSRCAESSTKMESSIIIMFKRFSLSQQCAYGAVSLVSAEVWIGYFSLLITIIVSWGLLCFIFKSSAKQQFHESLITVHSGTSTLLSNFIHKPINEGGLRRKDVEG